jgi:hypothetical protein
MAAKREKLTVEVEPDLRVALARWADEEGRPLGNLLRRIAAAAVAQHAQAERAGAHQS